MNQLTEIYKYLKETLESDTFVNTVSKVSFDEIDLRKDIIFPLANIRILNGNLNNGSYVTFSVQVGVFDVRDLNKEINTDRFWGNDNEVDNHNLCIAVLNRLWGKLYKDFNDVGILVSENPAFELGYFEKAKLLDGAILTFDIDVPNTTINLCS